MISKESRSNKTPVFIAYCRAHKGYHSDVAPENVGSEKIVVLMIDGDSVFSSGMVVTRLIGMKYELLWEVYNKEMYDYS